MSRLGAYESLYIFVYPLLQSYYLTKYLKSKVLRSMLQQHLKTLNQTLARAM